MTSSAAPVRSSTSAAPAGSLRRLRAGLYEIAGRTIERNDHGRFGWAPVGSWTISTEADGPWLSSFGTLREAVEAVEAEGPVAPVAGSSFDEVEAPSLVAPPVDEVETSDEVEAVEADRVEDPAAWTGSPVEAVVSASDLVARRDLRGRAVVAAGLVGFLAGAEAVGPLVRVSVRSVAGQRSGRILVDVLDPSEAVEILAETVEVRPLVGSDLLRPEFVGRRVEIGRDGRLPVSGLLVGADLRPVSGAVRVLVETRSGGLVRVPVSPLAPVSVVNALDALGR